MGPYFLIFHFILYSYFVHKWHPICVCVCSLQELHFPTLGVEAEKEGDNRNRKELEKKEQKKKSTTIQMVLSEEQHQQFVKEKKCILCSETRNQPPRQFKNKETIKRHNKVTHKNLKVVLTCGECNQAFTTKADLSLHEQLKWKHH